jgi:hypothetical protein
VRQPRGATTSFTKNATKSRRTRNQSSREPIANPTTAAATAVRSSGDSDTPTALFFLFGWGEAEAMGMYAEIPVPESPLTYAAPEEEAANCGTNPATFNANKCTHRARDAHQRDIATYRENICKV